MNDTMRRFGSTRWAVNGGQWAAALVVAVLWLAAGGTDGFSAKAEGGGDDGRGILRYAPLSGKLEPISPQEVKPGYIYSHFSPRLNKRVWSYAQGNGRFWDALGEGTTQEAWRLDLRLTLEEGWEILAQTAPRVARQLQQEGAGSVYLRLTSDNRWVIAEGASFPAIYSAETGHRWEKHSGRYIPVSSGPGQFQWALQRGRYVPAGQPRSTASSGGPGVVHTLEACGCR
jgi:hypothetical protein